MVASANLIIAGDNIDGGSGDDQAQTGKVRSTPEKSQVLAQVGRGSLGKIPNAPECRGERPPQLERGGGRLGCHRGGSGDNQAQVGNVRSTPEKIPSVGTRG